MTYGSLKVNRTPEANGAPELLSYCHVCVSCAHVELCGVTLSAPIATIVKVLLLMLTAIMSSCPDMMCLAAWIWCGNELKSIFI